MSERSDRAIALFKSGASCSQSVVAAYADLFGMDEKTAMLVASGFGGGMGRMREVCGVVSGMVILAGLKYGNSESSDAAGKKRVYEVVQKLFAAYKERYGSYLCRELLGLDKPEGDPKPSERTAAYYKKRPCAEMVGQGALMVEQFLLNDSK